MTSYPCPDCARRERLSVRGWSPSSSVDICAGAGTVSIDQDAIRAAIVATRGKNKGKLRASRPPYPGERNATEAVFGAAYVWRLIRFHVGQDYTLPVMADYYIGSPQRGADGGLLVDLDKLADEIGAELFGVTATYRAAARWGQALGLPRADEVAAAVRQTAGLPGGDGTDIGTVEDSPEWHVEQAVTE